MARALRGGVCVFFVLLSVVCVAQTTPGTFSAVPPVQPFGGLIVSPPSMSLGNGMTPPVVSSQPPVYVSAPPQTNPNVAFSTWAAGPPVAAIPPGMLPVPETVPAENFIYPSGVSLSPVTASSLGEAARMLRAEPRAPAKHVYTNEDVTGIAAREQSGATEQSTPTTTPQRPPSNEPAQPQKRPHEYTVPIGSAPPSDVVPAESAAKGQTQQQRHGNPFQPKVPPQGQGGATYPKTASLLPLLGALGGALVGAGLIYRSLRS